MVSNQLEDLACCISNHLGSVASGVCQPSERSPLKPMAKRSETFHEEITELLDLATAATLILLDAGFEIEEIDWDAVTQCRQYLNERIEGQDSE